MSKMSDVENLNVLNLLKQINRSTAVLWNEREISGAQLAQEVNSLCQDVSRNLDCPLSVPVAFTASHSWHSLVLILALLELRRPVFPLHPRWTQYERRSLIDRVGAVELERFPGGWKAASDFTKVSSLQRKPAVLMATSGSTSLPKVVCLASQALQASAKASGLHLGWNENDRWLLSLTLAHIGGLSIVIRCLLAGKPIILAPLGLSPKDLVQMIVRSRATLLSLVPTQLERIVTQCPDWKGRPLRAVLVGGARASQSLLQRARKQGIPAMATYGMTETASQIATQPLNEADDIAAVSKGAMLLPGVEARCELGQILVRGPMLFDGYWGEETQPLVEGWFCTGDAGSLDEQGRLHVECRREDRIVTGGENVSPAEVEKILENIPGVRAACVFGIFHSEWGEQVAAVLVPESNLVLSLQNLAMFWKGQLASYKEPRQVAMVPCLIIGPNGKVDRRATKQAWRSLLAPLPDAASEHACCPGNCQDGKHPNKNE